MSDVGNKLSACVEIEVNTHEVNGYDYLQAWYHNDTHQVHAMVMMSDVPVDEIDLEGWDKFITDVQEWAKERGLEVTSVPDKADYGLE